LHDAGIHELRGFTSGAQGFDVVVGETHANELAQEARGFQGARRALSDVACYAIGLKCNRFAVADTNASAKRASEGGETGVSEAWVTAGDDDVGGRNIFGEASQDFVSDASFSSAWRSDYDNGARDGVGGDMTIGGQNRIDFGIAADGGRFFPEQSS
jgi:hypothetical protein